MIIYYLLLLIKYETKIKKSNKKSWNNIVKK